MFVNAKQSKAATIDSTVVTPLLLLLHYICERKAKQSSDYRFNSCNFPTPLLLHSICELKSKAKQSKAKQNKYLKKRLTVLKTCCACRDVQLLLYEPLLHNPVWARTIDKTVVTLLSSFSILFVNLKQNNAFCLLVGCLTSQQQASVSQGRICSDNFTCCHTEIEVADQTFYLAQSQYTDTGPTSPSADPITPGAWQGSHWSAKF